MVGIGLMLERLSNVVSCLMLRNSLRVSASQEYYTYVEEIVPGFAADLSGQIQVTGMMRMLQPSLSLSQVGDIVLYVNDISLEGMPLDDIKQASRMMSRPPQ